MTARNPERRPAAMPGPRLLSWWRRMRGKREIASCMEVARALQAYLDGEVDTVTARRVARHLEICRRCGLEAQTYLAIKDTLARGGRDVDPAAVARLRAFGAHLIEVDVRPGPPEVQPGDPGTGPA